MTGSLIILNGSGHSTVEWDTEKEETVRKAMETFDREVRQMGKQPFNTTDKEAGAIAMQDKELPTNIEGIEVTIVPKIAGGC